MQHLIFLPIILMLRLYGYILGPMNPLRWIALVILAVGFSGGLYLSDLSDSKLAIPTVLEWSVISVQALGLVAFLISAPRLRWVFLPLSVYFLLIFLYLSLVDPKFVSPLGFVSKDSALFNGVISLATGLLCCIIDPYKLMGTVKGKWGEWTVRRSLFWLKLFHPHDYIVRHGVLLQEGQHSQELDHVVISKFGIFAIETKSKGGVIYGNEDDKHWKQVMTAQLTHEFHNPLLQNKGHIKSLKSILGEVTIHSVVVFINGRFGNPMPAHVMRQQRLRPYLRTFKQEVYSRADVERLADTLRSAAVRGWWARRRHLAFIKNKYG